jgi:phytoene desaturase (3,4-didehydrolycopene-forming)
VANALEQLATDLGVEIRCNTTVTRITSQGVTLYEKSSVDEINVSTRDESRRRGSKTEFLPADLIIVNADLPYAKASLISMDDQNDNITTMKSQQASPPTETFDWDDRFSFSSGVISFHWSVDKALEDLNTHNVFLVAGSRSQAEASWQVMRQRDDDDDDDDDDIDDKPFNFYVHRPAKSDPSAAPPGCDSIMVLVPCRTLLRDAECATLPRDRAVEIYKEQFSEEVVDDVRRAVLRRMAAVQSLQDLQQHIVHEVVDTPATWADQFHLAAGTPFGLVRQTF